ncbi:hypothetical protein ACF0H5_019516 [Mactra antiquata]
MVDGDIASGRVHAPVTGQAKNVFQHRWDNYKRVCLFTNISTTTTGIVDLFYAEKFRLATKITPKAGSTTLIAIFHMLNERTNEHVFNKSRMQMHEYSKNAIIKKKFKLDELGDIVFLLPTRNPYSRLYSAFVDKVYLADDVELAEAVTKHAGNHRNIPQWWKSNVSFQNFLDYTLDDSLTKHVQIDHYGKIFTPKYCLLDNPVLIIKQESFSVDIEYALKKVNVKNKILDVIRDVLTSSRAATTVSGVVKTELQKLKFYFRTRKVFKAVERRLDALQFIFKRLWSSFQIQGIINAHSVFPDTKFSSQRSVDAVDDILDIFLSEIKEHPLTSSERTEQRDKAMLDAYRRIDPRTIKKIQIKHINDFLAFEYDPALQL